MKLNQHAGWPIKVNQQQIQLFKYLLQNLLLIIKIIFQLIIKIHFHLLKSLELCSIVLIIAINQVKVFFQWLVNLKVLAKKLLIDSHIG